MLTWASHPNVTKRDSITDGPANSLALEQVYSKGPLLTVAVALFGEGSFLTSRVAWPDSYNGIDLKGENSGACNSCFLSSLGLGTKQRGRSGKTHANR